MPQVDVQECRGEKLPGIGVIHASAADSQEFTDEAGLCRFKKELGAKARDIEREQDQQDNARLMGQAPCKR
jgi:hypothetical protein